MHYLIEDFVWRLCLFTELICLKVFCIFVRESGVNQNETMEITISGRRNDIISLFL